jgi:dihydroorotase
LSLPKVLEKFTSAPARILKLNRGTLAVGAVGDVTILDPDRSWTFRRDNSASKSRNSPFDGWPMRGGAVATVVAGKLVWSEENRFVDVQCPD